MMKNPSKIRIALAVLCAAASMSARAGAILDEHLTAAAGDAAGNLTGSKWVGNLARFGMVDPGGTGTALRNPAETFETATRSTSPGIADRCEVGMEFSFNWACSDISDTTNTLSELLLSDGSANISLLFPRQPAPSIAFTS